ncbi:MAG: ATP phosphoribosyltransferase regulatory subunit, partial [Planctomycetes bacterium]|nr:ATP phosphoribosyltransferase regulatory subunit [Planctomycetota bacterium]
SLARMVVARQAALPKPIKWFNISRCCRYERAQKGRLREFFQWNCDILGAEGAAADAECILVAIDALREFGLRPENVQVRLSNRKLLAAMLKALGIADNVIPGVYLALDKRGKVPPDVLDKMLDDLRLSADQRQALDALFSMTSLEQMPEQFAADSVVEEAVGELRAIMAVIDAAGAGDLVRFDIGIVRGLAYYTGPVWEVFDTSSSLRSLFGGGRYDNLIVASGGKPMAACGFGAGDVTMGLLLDALQLWPTEGPRVDYYVAAVCDEAMADAVAYAARARRQGLSAQVSLSPLGVNRILKTAASCNARFAAVLGNAECPKGHVRVRNMADGAESVHPLDDVPFGKNA